MTEKSVQLIGDAGQGAAIAILRAGNTPSKAADVLAKDFRVLSYAVSGKTSAAADELAALLGSKVSEIALVADAASAPTAMALALAHADLVKAVALISPVAFAFGDLSGLMAPVLALFGAADPSRAADAPRSFCRAIPNCRLLYVYDAVGALDDARPEAVAAALHDFVTRREKFIVNARRNRLYP